MNSLLLAITALAALTTLTPAKDYTAEEAKKAMEALQLTEEVTSNGQRFAAGTEYYFIGKIAAIGPNAAVLGDLKLTSVLGVATCSVKLDPETVATIPSTTVVQAIIRYKETKETDGKPLRIFECVGLIRAGGKYWINTEKPE